MARKAAKKSAVKKAPAKRAKAKPAKSAKKAAGKKAPAKKASARKATRRGAAEVAKLRKAVLAGFKAKKPAESIAGELGISKPYVYMLKRKP